MARRNRHDGRTPAQLRAVRITPGFLDTADGSCLMEMGGTRVLCAASVSPGVPKWREPSGEGWLTAEYAMLPASTRPRKAPADLRPDSRSVEIRRMIGRVLRGAVRFHRLGSNTLHLDCHVLEADGGTRTASITGAYVAAALAADRAAGDGRCTPRVLAGRVAAVSVGMVDGRAVLDLDYQEDSRADVDMNVAMTGGGKFIEIQGTSEGRAFGGDELDAMLRLARGGCRKLMAAQREAIDGR